MLFGVHIFPAQSSFQPDELARAAEERGDKAVFASYDWKSDLSDEEIFENLLALNLERTKG